MDLILVFCSAALFRTVFATIRGQGQSPVGFYTFGATTSLAVSISEAFKTITVSTAPSNIRVWCKDAELMMSWGGQNDIEMTSQRQ